jgi:hypothetical protein
MERKNFGSSPNREVKPLFYLSHFFIFLLVPTARLELAQLSPLPPQDSVSTNSTTSAKFSKIRILPLTTAQRSVPQPG